MQQVIQSLSNAIDLNTFTDTFWYFILLMPVMVVPALVVYGVILTGVRMLRGLLS